MEYLYTSTQGSLDNNPIKKLPVKNLSIYRFADKKTVAQRFKSMGLASFLKDGEKPLVLLGLRNMDCNIEFCENFNKGLYDNLKTSEVVSILEELNNKQGIYPHDYLFNIVRYAKKHGLNILPKGSTDIKNYSSVIIQVDGAKHS